MDKEKPTIEIKPPYIGSDIWSILYDSGALFGFSWEDAPSKLRESFNDVAIIINSHIHAILQNQLTTSFERVKDTMDICRDQALAILANLKIKE